MSKIRIPEKEGLIIKLIEKYAKEKFSIDLQSDKSPF